MRRLLAAAALVAFVVTAAAWATPSRSAATCSAKTVSDGKLTVGTDNPAFPPWFGGTAHAPWKVGDPRSGKGFESAVAYAVAQQMGYGRAQVQWVYTPFSKAYAPGRKSFDFDINQISVTPERAKVVDFSNSYYDVVQSIVVV